MNSTRSLMTSAPDLPLQIGIHPSGLFSFFIASVLLVIYGEHMNATSKKLRPSWLTRPTMVILILLLKMRIWKNGMVKFGARVNWRNMSIVNPDDAWS